MSKAKYIKVENFENDGLIKIVTLNRPEVKNAFHPEMIAEITEFFATEKHSKFIVLRGEGSVFCAGADINWMKNMINYSFEENVEDSKKLWEMFEAIQYCPTPIVAIVEGAVFGGALGLLSCCDYVFAEEKTKFCFSEVKLGLAPAVISGFISRKIPDTFYRSYMLSAEIFSAEDSKRMGLVQRIFSSRVELSEVLKKFQPNGIEAMRETKKLLNYLITVPPAAEKKEYCTRLISELRMSDEAQERMKKFL